MELVEFVIVDHFVPACVAALWFVAGALVAIPSTRWKIGWMRRSCLWLIGRLLGLFGHRPGLARTAITIFVFNGSAMFLYMSAGIRPFIPKFIAFMTGLVIAYVFLDASTFEELFDARMLSSTDYRPGPVLTLVCSAATALLELPCFFFALGMGIGLGQQLASDADGYWIWIEKRAIAYGAVLLPVLLLSAGCESVSISGARPPENPEKA